MNKNQRKEKLKNILNKFKSLFKKNWKIVLGIALLLTFFTVFIILKMAEEAKPKPILVTYSVKNPDNTNYEKNKIYPLQIDFRGTAAKIDEVGKTPTFPPEIVPPIEGKWVWNNDSTIIFTPNNAWEIGESYKVSLPKELFPKHIEVKNRSFDFKINPFKIYFSKKEFYIDPQNSKIKRILANISCNYPVDKNSIEGKIFIKPKIKADSGAVQLKNYNFTTSFSDDEKTVYIVSEPIGMPADDLSMEIIINPGIISAYGGAEIKDRISSSVLIHGVSSYVKINSVEHQMIKNDKNKYEQVVIIHSKGETSQFNIEGNIEFWQLPKDKPDLAGLRGKEDYNWRNVDDVVPEVLKLSKKLNFEIISTKNEYNSINSFKIEAKPDSYVYIKLKAGTKFYGGYYLSKDYQTIFRAKDYPRELAILSEGSILSFSGGRKLSMLSLGVNKVEYKISRIRPDDLNHLVAQTYGDMTNFNFKNYNFDEENISEIYRSSKKISNSEDPQDLTYFSFDFNNYLTNIPNKNLRNGLFIFTVSGQKPYSNYSQQRFILVTDLGIIVKSNNNTDKDIFVQSIADGSPVSGAVIELWGKNGNVIESLVTGYDGHAKFNNLEHHKNEHEPAVWVVKKENDLSFIPYSGFNRKLDFSDFDTGGIRGAQDPRKLTAYLFSDRGIYRPGDNFNIGLIIKAGDWGIDLEGTPLECNITDPSGLQIYSESIKLGSSGFEEINYTTQNYSPTGIYNISLYVKKKNNKKDFLGSTQIKVEEFLPDTLTVNSKFVSKPTKGWISPKDITAQITARNLFGTPAAGNKVNMKMTLSPGYQHFKDFSDYEFFDPLIKKEHYEEKLGTQYTDESGTVSQKINIGNFDKGTYNLRIDADVYEKESGRSVSTVASVVVSPMEFIVGRKLDGSANYIKKNTKRNISFIAISDKIEPIEANGLIYKINEIKYISSLVRQPNGVYKYKSVKKEDTILEKTMSIKESGTTISLPTDAAGEFIFSVYKDDTIISKTPFSVIGDENIHRSLNRTAELELKINKKDFEHGEEAEIFIKAPYPGSGLITIERDKVYSFKWFEIKGNSTTEYITIPKELEGNGYFTVSLTRSQKSSEIYMSPLSYAIMPFSVSKASRTNIIKLDIAKEAKPGENFPITYSSSKSGKIVIFAVDEGILQVGRYKTPDPISYYFRKRALEVSTSQIMDLILPEFDVVKSLSAIGGGIGADELSKNLNPFKRKKLKPVAYWSGIVDSSEEKRTLNYKIPEYFNGSLRVMALAVSQNALGAEEKTSLIRSPWVIQPNIPLSASPDDEFDISVAVTNMNKGSGIDSKAILTVKPSKHLSVIGKNSFNLSIDEGKDSVIKIRIKANKIPGSAELRFNVSGLGKKSGLSSYLSVRPSTPFRTEIKTGVIEKSDKEESISRELYNQFAERKISASNVPISIADGLNFYLDKFPYGCTEQITSMTFPKLYPQLIEKLDMDSSDIRKDIKRTINILQARQKNNGAFGLWTSNSDSHRVIDAYVMHFLTIARDKNYYVPASVFNAGLKRLKEIASEKRSEKNDLTYKCYAVYILTLNEIVTTSYIEKLTVDLENNFEDWKEGFAGMFLAGSYALMKQQKKADALIKKAVTSVKHEKYLDYYNSLCYSSVYLHMLGEYFPNRLRFVSNELLTRISEEIGNRSYSTFSANYAMLGINSYLKSVSSSNKSDFNLIELNSDEQETTLKLTGDVLLSSEYSATTKKVRIENNNSTPLFYQIISAGYDLEMPEKKNNGIEVFKEYVTDKGEIVDQIPIGNNINVRIRCRSLDDKTLHNIAIVDLLPAGLEADIRSIRDANSSNPSNSIKTEYIDIREDRVILFVSVDKNIKEFTYKARAINTGNYTVPPAFAESMYDLNIWSINPCKPLIITE